MAYKGYKEKRGTTGLTQKMVGRDGEAGGKEGKRAQKLEVSV